MKSSVFSPYEGNEPYCFVSYAHKDLNLVRPILEELFRRDYRIWYDDGIAPGSEWPEYIAQHINGSSVVIAFVSNSSIESPNCRREVTYALSKKKPFIGIFLEKTKMSPGMELQLSAQQCIMKYQIADDETFYRKLCDTDIFAVCHNDSPAEPASGPAETVSESKDIDAKDMAVVSRRNEAVKEPKKEPEKDPEAFEPDPVNEEKSQHLNEVRKEDSDKKKKKKILKGIASGAAVLAAALIILCVKLSSSGSKTTELGQGTLKISGDSVTFTDAMVDKKAIRAISYKGIKSLYFTNCTVIESLSELKQLDQITTVSCKDTRMNEWNFLSGLINGRLLLLDNCNISSDALRNLGAFRNISLKNCSQINDISMLKTDNLTDLDLSGTGVTDISSLSNAEKLVNLTLNDTAVADLDPIAGLTDLNSLSADRVHFTLTKPLMSLSLKKVSLQGCGLENADFMDYATILSDVDLRDNILISADWLLKSSESLKRLYLGGNQFSREWCSCLKEMQHLTELDLDGLPLLNLDFMKSMSEMEILHAADAEITDISGISGCRKLRELYLSGNRIREIDLAQHTALRILDLSNNRLTTADRLPDASFNALLLQGNKIPVETLPGRVTGGYFVMDYTPFEKKDLFNCTKLFLLNCPPDKQLKVTELTHNNAKFVDEEFVARNLKDHGYNLYAWTD